MTTSDTLKFSINWRSHLLHEPYQFASLIGNFREHFGVGVFFNFGVNASVSSIRSFVYYIHLFIQHDFVLSLIQWPDWSLNLQTVKWSLPYLPNDFQIETANRCTCHWLDVFFVFTHSIDWLYVCVCVTQHISFPYLFLSLQL